jgi:hypothetical protein
MENTQLLLKNMRLKHKTILLNYIFKFSKVSEVNKVFYNFWLDQLLQGRGLDDVISGVNKWKAVGLKSDLNENLINTNGKVSVNDDYLEVIPGEYFSIKVKVANNSASDWFSNEQSQVFLSYCWYLENGYKYGDDAIRTRIDPVLAKGKFREIDVNIKAPPCEGSFSIQFTIVKEHYFWFHEYGLITTKKLVAVKNDYTNLRWGKYFSDQNTINKKSIDQTLQLIESQLDSQ